ncbi:1-phosphofructokinase family hexose kinase [Trinickia dinghuensis]|uniref:Phosphofructokinase n=1 Tax=Trinickia dinghuensis TaxID=2291023 RepID=A0A3D8K2H7_9BURK|nr:1-phosphofructokinase family hexose kinase [Trinickia dinghuensis]RDU99360.1 1-phosphofructokinase family hexose kinase [Trinickia dinghuensis]
MSRILTVTLNPAVDLSTAVERVTDTSKLRCDAALKHPGGGGINVARMINRLGGDCIALYLAGGPLGQELCQLIEAEGVRGQCIEIAGETRESFAVYEKSTGRQFRFVLPGPVVSEREWESCLERFESFEPAANYLVLSGSLPPGVPADIYVSFICAARANGTRVVLDSSGPALRAALDAGVFLVKPSLGELSELAGRALAGESEWRAAALHLVRNGRAQIVALTLGSLGALLVTEHEVLRAGALPVSVVSAIGAGDALVGALVWALDRDLALAEAFRYGLAAASASLASPGTGLCNSEEVERIYRQVDIK